MLFSECLTRGRTGDPAALEELFGRWRPLLRLQARKLLGAELAARVDPSDVVQEALLQSAHDLAQFRGTSQGEWVAWLRRLVAGHAAKAQRCHHAGRRTVDREAAPATSAVPDRRTDVVTRLVQAEDAARVAAAVETLPEAMREVVIRRLIDRASMAAVAQALGLAPAAVRALLSQAARRLAAQLEA
jgi:RNA polymerase sigma-70 factor (ECF subfamily)